MERNWEWIRGDNTEILGISVLSELFGDGGKLSYTYITLTIEVYRYNVDSYMYLDGFTAHYTGGHKMTYVEFHGET